MPKGIIKKVILTNGGSSDVANIRNTGILTVQDNIDDPACPPPTNEMLFASTISVQESPIKQYWFRYVNLGEGNDVAIVFAEVADMISRPAGNAKQAKELD